MSRWKVAAIHFGISLSVVLVLAAALSVTWYPPAYARVVGGLALMGILAGVDACLGPLLTLIVYKQGKPGLRFDLTVIAVLQVAALGYGLHTIFLARPVYLVYAVDRFEVIRAADIPDSALALAKREEFRALPLSGPKIIGAHPPDDPREREKLMFGAIAGGADLPQLPQYYVPYAELRETVLAHAKPVEGLMAKGPMAREKLTDYLRAHDLDAARVRYVPLQFKDMGQTMLLDSGSAATLGIVDLDPWQDPATAAGH